MSSMEKFKTIGSRLAEIKLDETVLTNAYEGKDGDFEAEAIVKVTATPPEISDGTYKSRPVIEAGIEITMSMVKSGRKSAKASVDTQAIRMVFYAGFVGTSEKFDGDLSLFKSSLPDHERIVYWMNRSFITQILGNTLYSSAPFPWDLQDAMDQKVQKPRAKPRKKLPDRLG